MGPDQTPTIIRLARISLVKKLMKKWSVTQNLTFREQLEAGIRYFDLRVSSKPGDADQEIYFIHGLFGIKVWDGLMEIDTFLTQHPREIVFLDFNHFYAMDEAHHKHLVHQIQDAFGNKLCSACSVESLTLQILWEKKCQVGGNRDELPRARTELFLPFLYRQLSDSFMQGPQARRHSFFLEYLIYLRRFLGSRIAPRVPLDAFELG